MKKLRLFFLLLCGFVLASGPAKAIIGGLPGSEDMARHVVMIISGTGMCSATVIADDLLLTAGHCLSKGGEYRLMTKMNGKAEFLPIGTAVVHPQFRDDAYAKREFTIDLALLHLKSPLKGYEPLRLSSEKGVESDLYQIAGFGQTAENIKGTDGVLHELRLPGVAPVSSVQLRLQQIGRIAGSCNGDSGGPALRYGRLVGIVTSAVGPETGKLCGGLTGVTLIGAALPWIRSNAAKFGVSLP